MSPQSASGTNYTVVPSDFPYENDSPALERCLDWNVCEELALHLAGECARVKRQVDRSVRPVDILLRYYRLVEAKGWGEPPVLRWVFGRVADVLNWPVPDIARRP